MRNLLIFITKYNAFFLFVIFEIIALTIFVKNNNFQKATFISSSNKIVGNIYLKVDQLTDYLKLGITNDSLAQENARLRNQLKSSFYVDSSVVKTVSDTVYKQQYTYISARVINNSFNRRNNYLTINRGSNAGIAKGMGVISSSGVVGIVINTGPDLSTVQSLLHENTRISAMLADSNNVGSLIWDNNLDPTKAMLINYMKQVKIKRGTPVVTSGYSLFPTGTMLGRISNLDVKDSNNGTGIEVNLSVNFSNLQYVYVVKNKLALEQQSLEAQEKQ
ncbi:rod shape-determining protein MreC [Mucilaginibacter sp.]|uniref:rod shape-determining protein MreC n=1 Tax=Mucilaginibacter sp. TaxID=1882438 RepID=UPI003AFF74ED